MSKKGPLGTAEMFYVEEKHKSGTEIEQIAKDLDRTMNQIEKYLSSISISKPKNMTIVEEQFVRQRGATIMTENASTMIDSLRRPKNTNNIDCVTKLKND
jgi:hypothetical protein